MPNVSFTLKTFGLKLTRDMRANVVFTPSRPSALSPEGILIGRVVVPFSHINEETGLATVELAQTTLLRPATHYIVSVEWLDGSPSGWAEINWPIRVPAGGGALSNLMELPPEPGSILIGYDIPHAIRGVLAVDIKGNENGLAELVVERGAIE